MNNRTSSVLDSLLFLPPYLSCVQARRVTNLDLGRALDRLLEGARHGQMVGCPQAGRRPSIEGVVGLGNGPGAVEQI